MKKILGLIFACALCAGFASCCDDDDEEDAALYSKSQLVGTWYSYYATDDEMQDIYGENYVDTGYFWKLNISEEAIILFEYYRNSWYSNAYFSYYISGSNIVAYQDDDYYFNGNWAILELTSTSLILEHYGDDGEYFYWKLKKE